MKPHKPNNKSKANALGKARMLYKKDLWWLSGYPVKDGWQPLRPGIDQSAEPEHLSREQLSRATYTSRKLLGEYAAVAPKLFKDPKAWQEGLSILLKHLKPIVHQGDAAEANLFSVPIFSPQVSRQALSLAARHPQLKPLLDGCSWYLCTRPWEASKYLKLIQSQASGLSALLGFASDENDIEQCMYLLMIGISVGEKYLAPLTEWLLAARQYDCKMYDEGDRIKGVLKMLSKQQFSAEKPARTNVPRSNLMSLLSSQIAWVAGLEKRDQKKYLTILQCLDLPVSMRSWDEWWQAATSLIKTVNHELKKDTFFYRCEKREALIKKASAVHQQTPDAINLNVLLRAIKVAIDGKTHHPSSGQSIAQSLQTIASSDTSTSVKINLFCHWVFLPGNSDPEDRRLIRPIIQCFAEYVQYVSVQKLNMANALAPWLGHTKTAGKTGYSSYGVDDVLMATESVKDIKTFFELLKRTHDRRTDWSLTDTQNLLAIAQVMNKPPKSAGADSLPKPAGLDSSPKTAGLESLPKPAELALDLAISYFLSLNTNTHFHRNYTYQVLAASHQLSKSPSDFSDIANVLHDMSEVTELDLNKIADVLKIAFQGYFQELIALLKDSKYHAMLSLARKLSLFATLKSPYVPTSLNEQQCDAWLNTFPPQLHDNLRKLNHVTPVARDKVSKLLKADLRDAQAINREIEAIESRIDDVDEKKARQLRSRIESLKAKVQKDDYSRAHLEKMRQKVLRLTGREMLLRIESTLEGQLADALNHYFNHDDAHAFLSQGRRLELLGSLLALPASFRKWIKRIVQVRLGPPPWDFRDLEGNQAFQRKMKRRGLDMAPWINGLELELSHQENKLKLALEIDPFEIFMMGSYFRTCLSVDSMNFFSTVANCLDINKRVLYLKDENGKVLARRLMCLSDQGKIILFHAYAHDGNLNFPALSEKYAKQLADKMGTGLAHSESISNPVSPDWYNDGPVAPRMQHEYLEEDSEFRQKLLSGPQEKISGLIRKVTGTVKLDEALATRLIGLTELDQKPTIMIDLLPLIRHPDQLDESAYIRIARLMEKAGHGPQTVARFATQIERYVTRLHRQEYWIDEEIWHLTARTHPTFALRLIKKTRARHVKTWEDEEASRLYAAGIALRKLNRYKQSLKMFNLLQQTGGNYMKSERKQQISELNALIQ